MSNGFPKGWRHLHGAYYYEPPRSQTAAWGGKRIVRLGKTLPEAYRTWAVPWEVPGRKADLSNPWTMEDAG